MGSSLKRSVPGPGHYTNHADINDWYKKTFNFRYLKQYHIGEQAAAE